MGLIEDIAEKQLELLEVEKNALKLEQMKALSDSSVEGRSKYYEISAELSHVERQISELKVGIENPYSFDARKPFRDALRAERSRLLQQFDEELDSEKKAEIQAQYVEVTNQINMISS